MDLEQLKEQFYRLVAPSLPNEWDVEDALGPLVNSEAARVDEIFAQIPAIWPVSHALCFTYLSAAGPALCHLALDELSLWVHSLLDRYESGGLMSAQVFMTDVERQFSRQLRGQGGLRLSDVRPRLQPYVNGLAGRELPLLGAAEASTDAETIFLPGEVGVFAVQEENFLLYKLMVSFQWASLAAGVFATPRFLSLHRKHAHPLDCFFAEFLEPDHARRLFHLLETGRVMAFLRQELPGLMRAVAPLLPRLPLAGDAHSKNCNVLDWMQRGLLRDQWPVGDQSPLVERVMALQCACGQATDNSASLEAVGELMPLIPATHNLATTDPLIFQGVFRLQEMRNLGMQQQADRELRLMQASSVTLPAGRGEADADPQPGNEGGQRGYDAALLMEMDRAWDQLPPFMQSQGLQINISETPPAGTPAQERGATRAVDQTISATEGRAGSAVARGPQGGGALKGKTEELTEPVVYDEWDYRRKGFRKKWCVVNERELTPVRNAFIEQTLAQYRGQIRRLRRQFELLRTGERFVRRQREGNDIDFDAMVDFMTDQVAGLAPTDRLFIRLTRDHRDIAAAFLVDMSNSTSGWVGQAIKEALVLICEAMELLNDRYAIYGFSGMRRLRCEIFPVKRMHEQYSQTVRQRISAIGPQEYTRMAPAIRHMVALLSRVEARIRLLIVLSDGKPEDYDDYKGDYAIEDTRHALQEARSRGIHPFCIAIDRQAHAHMAHMYGEGQYIFIDKIQQLPARMAEIYRTLTS